MPGFSLKHPHDPELRAVYGFEPDPLIAYFVDCFAGDDFLLFYRASEPNYQVARPLLGALQFLVMLQFLSGQHLEEALDALARPEPVGRISRSARRALKVVVNFRKAAE